MLNTKPLTVKQKRILDYISESQVEDALVTNLMFLANILNLPSDLKLISRQLRLKSGEERIDLLLSSGKNLCLVELKVVKYVVDWLKQIISYHDELINLQNAGGFRCPHRPQPRHKIQAKTRLFT